jgi:UDPglucose 6-dehydrogenase
MKIAVVGTGYVGLVTGTCFADWGNLVTCIDTDEGKISRLKKGEIPIFEPGLAEMVLANQKAGRLRFTTSLAEGIHDAQLIFIAVGTPQSDDGTADLTALWKVTDYLAELLQHPVIVVIKSTVPPGTNRLMSERFRAKAKVAVDVVNNPEFLKEGVAIDDCQRPDRVVIGLRQEALIPVFQEIYQPVLSATCPLAVMTPESAEMTKYTANAFLAMKISFINEMANLCEKVGANINDVRTGIGHDRRIGFQFLHPGPGYGGSCFPKDVSALIRIEQDHQMPARMLLAVAQTNAEQKELIPQKIRNHFGATLAGKTLAVWGLAFKPRTDDIRDAPALIILRRLLDAGVRLKVHDPEAMANIRKEFGEVLQYCASPQEAAQHADALVILTEWDLYRKFQPQEIRQLLREPIVFDGRNLFEPLTMAKSGIYYHSIGRELIMPKAGD